MWERTERYNMAFHHGETAVSLQSRPGHFLGTGQLVFRVAVSSADFHVGYTVPYGYISGWVRRHIAAD